MKKLVLIISLLIIGCHQVDRGGVDLSLKAEEEFIGFNGSTLITAVSSRDTSSVIWYVDGAEQSERGASFTFTDSAGQERRYTIHASFGNGEGESNTVELRVTLYPKLRRAVHNFIKRYNIRTALSVAAYRPNSVDFSFSDGYTSLSKMSHADEATLHYLYSITKTFVAAEVLRLVSAGELSLGDTVQSLLPEVRDELFINQEATVEQLLSHTSGIQEYVTHPFLFSQNPFRDKDWDPRLLIDFIEGPPLDVGTFIYSSMNFILLGLIVESTTGEPLNKTLRREFLDPLNLTSLLLHPQDEIPLDSISHPHVYPFTDLNLPGDGVTPIDIISIIPDGLDLLGKSSWAAGGMLDRAGAKDVAQWGYRLYSPHDSSIEAAIKEALQNSAAPFIDSGESGYGLGLRVIFVEGSHFLGSYGRSIGSENLLFYNPETDTSFAILTSSNTNKEKVPEINDLLADLYRATLNEES